MAQMSNLSPTTSLAYCCEIDAQILQTIAGMFMSILERQLGDSGFIEFAETFCDHTVVLFLGRAGQR